MSRELMQLFMKDCRPHKRLHKPSKERHRKLLLEATASAALAGTGFASYSYLPWLAV